MFTSMWRASQTCLTLNLMMSRIVLLVSRQICANVLLVNEVFLKRCLIHIKVYLLTLATLLSGNNVFKAHKHAKEFSGQSMLKFFDSAEIVNMPPDMKDKINNQVLDKKTLGYGHNYGNYILCCTHKKKFN